MTTIEFLTEKMKECHSSVIWYSMIKKPDYIDIFNMEKSKQEAAMYKDALAKLSVYEDFMNPKTESHV